MKTWRRRRLLAMSLLAWLAFALRMIHLADVPPRWDEGWSVAHAALPFAELLSITAQDVHPPLFYMLLGAWQSLVGVNLVGARVLCVLMALPAIPLAYVSGKVWARSSTVGLLSALLMAWLPLHVYYSAVVRMYALAPTLLLLATYVLLKYTATQRSDYKNILAFVIGATGAMLTLYHAAWALLALGLYVLLAPRVTPHALRSTLLPIAAAMLGYVPWAIYAIPKLLGRAGVEAATNTGQQYPLSYFMRLALSGLTLSQFSHDWGLYVIVAIIVAGVSVALIRRQPLGVVLLPLGMIASTVIFVAIAARQWALNERMLVGAAPGLALLLAWALWTLGRAIQPSRPHFVRYAPALLASVALVGVYWPTSTDYVYRKSLEVFDPYNPHTYVQHIAPLAQPTDIVFFNVLSPAGFYALDRHPNDPNWSYALTWDPVKEPRRDWENRVLAYAQSHSRMWFVLYRGLAGKNGDLRGWLDSSFYPAHAEWGEEEVFYGLYGFPPHALPAVPLTQARWPNLELRQAQRSSHVRRGDIIAVRLDWQVTGPITTNYKIFVHARNSIDGSVVAQHDAMPLNDLRPFTSLPRGEDVRDNHGLALPPDFRGTLNIVLGLYDPDTGQRVPLLADATEISLGQLTIE